MSKRSMLCVVAFVAVALMPSVLGAQQPVNYEVKGRDVPRQMQVGQFFALLFSYYEGMHTHDLMMNRLGVDGDEAREAVSHALRQYRALLGHFETQVEMDPQNDKVVRQLITSGANHLSSRAGVQKLADIYADLEEALTEAGFSYSVVGDYIDDRLAPNLSAISLGPFDAQHPTRKNEVLFEERVAKRRAGRGDKQ